MNNQAYQQYLQQFNGQLGQLPQLPQAQSQLSATPQDAGNTMIQGGQDMNNVLSMYKQMQQGAQTGNFGKPPAGMSQSQWNGLCEAFAEQQAFGKTGLFPSASAAAQHYAQNGQLNPDLSKAKPGDLVYFSDPNQPDGHVGLMGTNGNFTSATYNGVQTNPLQAWIQSTKQQPLGFVSMGR